MEVFTKIALAYATLHPDCTVADAMGAAFFVASCIASYTGHKAIAAYFIQRVKDMDETKDSPPILSPADLDFVRFAEMQDQAHADYLFHLMGQGKTSRVEVKKEKGMWDYV